MVNSEGIRGCRGLPKCPGRLSSFPCDSQQTSLKGEFFRGTKDVRRMKAEKGEEGQEHEQKRPNDASLGSVRRRYERRSRRRWNSRWKGWRRKRITKWTSTSRHVPRDARSGIRKVMVSGVRPASDAARVWHRARTYRALPSWRAC